MPQTTSFIVSPGFVCMLHCIGGEFEIDVIQVYHVEQFIRSNKPPHIAIELLVKIIADGSNFAPLDRLVLRKNMDTISFGIICNAV